MTKSLVGLPIWVMLLAAGVVLPHAITAGEIHDAVRSGDAAAVKALLDKSPALVNAKNESGQAVGPTGQPWRAMRRNAADRVARRQVPVHQPWRADLLGRRERGPATQAEAMTRQKSRN